MPTFDRASRLVSAALRHVDDAELLLSRSPDQSWHLAGFGPECVRKACLEERWLDKALGHDLTQVGDQVLALAMALDPLAARYEITDLRSTHPKLVEWDPQSRYDATGTRTPTDAQALCTQATAFTRGLAAELWMDGRIAEVS